MYRKIQLTHSDLNMMITEAVKRIYSLNEENIWTGRQRFDDSETITMGREFTLEYGVCAGLIDMTTGEVYPNKGLDYRDLESVQKALQSEIDFRKAHLQNSLGAFARKMNNLDPEINITIGEFEPFIYKAEVILTMPLPSTTYVDPEIARIHGAEMATGKVFGKASDKTNEWIKSQNFEKATQWPVFYKKVPGTPEQMYKTSEVEATGYKCYVTYSKSGFKLGGYRYVGVVMPMTNADSEDIDALYSGVKLTQEFEKNPTLLDYLRKVSAKVKCDGCGKKTSRSYYYVFMDKDDKLYFYGRNCATKIFGIDVAEKLDNYMRGLSKLGECFDGPTQGDNVPGEKIRQVMAIMIKDGILGEKKKFDYKSILDRAGNLGNTIEYREKYGEESLYGYDWQVTLEDLRFYDKNFIQLNAFLSDFLTNGNEFFRSIDSSRANDFVEKVKVVGINMTSGDDHALRGTPGWAVPYALQMYFTAKITRKSLEAEKDNSIAGKYPQFSGYKTFNCVVSHIDRKTSRNGSNYLVVQAVTEENGVRYGIQWFMWNFDSDFVEGKRLTVGGIYSKYNSNASNYTTLDNVKVVDDTNVQAGGGNDQEIQVGDRLKGEKVVVKKVYEKTILVTTSGGYDFYIYTMDYKSGFPKYPIRFTEGMTLTVDGTMQISNNGKPFLNRCKIIA